MLELSHSLLLHLNSTSKELSSGAILKRWFLREVVGGVHPHMTDSNENRCGGRFPPKINPGGHILAKY